MTATVYVDPNSVHNPSTGAVAPAAWGDTLRDCLEFLIDPPACSVFHNTTQSVSSGSGTILNANSETADNDAMHSTVSNTSRITINTAGRYQFQANVQFAGNVTGYRQIQFQVNGATVFATDRMISVGSNDTIFSCVAFRTLIVGDYVEVNVFQNSGSSLNVTLNEFTACFRTR